MGAFRVLVMGGEGIGPEITAEGVRVLRALQQVSKLSVSIEEHQVGEEALKRTGRHLPIETEQACDQVQEARNGAILFGAVREEPIGLLRQRYDLFANLRPIRMYPPLVGVSPLKPERVRAVDMLVVRELVGDVYYGRCHHGAGAGGRWASQEMYYDEAQVRRIVRVGLEQARRRRGRLTLVHKGNVIQEVFAIWQAVLEEERRSYPEIHYEDLLVDNMAMQMVLRPADFDVLLCSNLFGDILSDLGGGLLGSIGLLPSASLNVRGFALYESVGGTAPTIAGQCKANPLSTILSVALMCRYTFQDEASARLIEEAVEQAVRTYRTEDILEAGCTRVSTSEMGEQVVASMLRIAREGRST